MKKIINGIDSKYILIAIFLFTIYLFWGIGIWADEVYWIRESPTWYPKELIGTPIGHYLYMLPIELTSFNTVWIIDILHILYINISIYLIYKYLSLYHSRNLSLLLSFFIVVSFIYDGSSFWFLGTYIILSTAFLMYSFYLIKYNKIKEGILFSFLGSFSSYSSPIITAGLSLVFLWKRDIKRFLIFVTPNFLYIVYYLFVTKYLHIGVSRVHVENINVLKQLILQVATFFDSITFGLFFKVFYLLRDLPITYYIISLVLTFIILKFFKFTYRLNKELLLAFFGIMIFGFIVLALTGGYYQTVFTISNRILFFSMLLIIYLLIAPDYNRYIKMVVIFIFLSSIFATSLHWKKWSEYSVKESQNIVNEAKKLKIDELFIYDISTSKLGELNHLNLSLGNNNSYGNLKIKLLNHTYTYKDGYLIRKENNKKTKIDKFIYVYFLDRDKIEKVNKDDINKLIDNSRHSYRHWSQTLDNNSSVKKFIYKVMPSLKYEK